MCMYVYVYIYIYIHIHILITILVISIRELYITNSNIHGRNTRYGSDIHQTISYLSLYQRASYDMGLKVFNNLPAYVRDISYNVL